MTILTRDLDRRTALGASAWAVAAITSAVTVSAAAASTTLALAFGAYSYTGVACSTITGVSVTATTTAGGAPVVGAAVTVTLADGYSFPDGTTTRSDVTDSQGTIALPAISVPSSGGTSSLVATNPAAAAATASVSAAAKLGIYRAINGSAQMAFPRVSSGVALVGGDYFLDSTGQLYRAETVILRSVASAVGGVNRRGEYTVDYMTTGGTAGQALDFSPTSVFPGVPAGSQPVGARAFLASNGDLYYQNAKIATGIAIAKGTSESVSGSAVDVVAYRSTSGAAALAVNGAVTALTGVPQNSTPVGSRYFLSPAQELFFGNTSIATSVSSAVGAVNAGGSPIVGFIGAGGVAHTMLATGTDTTYSQIPAAARPLGAGYFLASDGRLFFGGSVVASDVVKAVAGWAFVPHDIANYVVAVPCSAPAPSPSPSD